MRIDLSKIDQTQFMIHQHVVNGEIVHLVQPQYIGVRFTQQNKIFRSSLWDSDGNLISGAFYKFPNWGENPENFPVPVSLKDTNIVEKIDGSVLIWLAHLGALLSVARRARPMIKCANRISTGGSLLIVSKWKNNYIFRTRGTVDATKLANGHELEIFKQKYGEFFNGIPFSSEWEANRAKYPSLFQFPPYESTWPFSFLFEWVSPTQKIVLNYGDSPEWYLVGGVYHDQ